MLPTVSYFFITLEVTQNVTNNVKATFWAECTYWYFLDPFLRTQNLEPFVFCENLFKSQEEQLQCEDILRKLSPYSFFNRVSSCFFMVLWYRCRKSSNSISYGLILLKVPFLKQGLHFCSWKRLHIIHVGIQEPLWDATKLVGSKLRLQL